MLKRALIAVVVMLSAPALPAQAQFGQGEAPRFYADFKPVVGGWAEYRMQSRSGKPLVLRIAIVGKEGNAYWYETAMDQPQKGKIVTKMLVSGDPADQTNVKRMILKAGSDPAMEMPAMMPRAPQGQRPAARGKFVDKGSEEVAVPAGTFKATHLQYQGENGQVVDTWVSKDVTLYGLVKSKGKDFEMVLLKSGSGAKTQITETPQKINMPQMPGMFGGRR